MQKQQEAKVAETEIKVKAADDNLQQAAAKTADATKKAEKIVDEANEKAKVDETKATEVKTEQVQKVNSLLHPSLPFHFSSMLPTSHFHCWHIPLPTLFRPFLVRS